MLESVADQVWVAEDAVRIPGAWLPARMTIVRLPSGGLWVHSPLAPRDALLTAVRQLGPVEHVVAPNTLHHLFVGDWMRAFPNAQLWRPEALVTKRPDLELGRALSTEARPEWRSHLHMVTLGGAPKLSETVFFHESSRTLLCSDLVFNITEPAGFVLGLVLRLAGTHGRLGCSRLLRSSYVGDRGAWAQSLDEVLELPFEQLVPAHGARVTENARSRLAAALRPDSRAAAQGATLERG